LIPEVVLHTAVMSKEVIDLLNPRPGQVFVDCTMGTGGHAGEILKRILPKGRVIGIDRDAESLEKAKARLEKFSDSCTLVNDDFRNLDAIFNRLNIQEIDGVLFDLGISSWQLDASERGFSIKQEGPLDMRMDKHSYISAYDLVNSLSEKEIATILKTFGQERFHNRIAHLLVEERNKGQITTTKELSDIVLKAIPYRYQSHSIHPATRTFQAFRIAVNRELEALGLGLEKAINHLSKGARVGVISFHSLEDKIVKDQFKKFQRQKMLKIVTSKPLRPSAEEMRENPRSRSAKLRVAERA
jgi:16S rRNA (cytosine1402-N4)-methyltransferase